MLAERGRERGAGEVWLHVFVHKESLSLSLHDFVLLVSFLMILFFFFFLFPLICGDIESQRWERMNVPH